MFGKAIGRSFVAAAILSYALVAQAVTIDLVTVGNAGNDGGWSGESYGGNEGGAGPNLKCGAVSYEYQIGKYEVTATQYTEFLNAVATVSDTYELYNSGMLEARSCGIERLTDGSSGNYTYRVKDGYENRPVSHVGCWDAMRFCNWMHNGQGDGDTETGAYTIIITEEDPKGALVTRNPEATWCLPSEDEWYKAAYHKNIGTGATYFHYPTGSNLLPGHDMTEITKEGNNANYINGTYPIDGSFSTTEVGEFEFSESPYGTFDQGGNVWELNETIITITDSARGLRGGNWDKAYKYMKSSYRNKANPNSNFYYVGFRVAYVPEPGSIAMLIGTALMGLLCYAWKKRK